MKMVIDILYCVDLIDELRDCWLICDIIYSLNSTVKGGAHILHNLITCKYSISYFHIFIKRPKSFIKWNENMIMIIFHFMYGSIVLWRYSIGRKNFLLFKHVPIIWIFFVQKMLDLPQWSISQVKSRCLVY